MNPTERTPRVPALVRLVVVTAVPLAWAVETLVRKWVLGDDFETLRTEMRPYLLVPALVLLGLAFLVAGLATVFGRRAIARKRRAKRKESGLAGEPTPRDDDDDGNGAFRWREKEMAASFFLWSSLAQAPAILGTLLFLVGGPFLPTVAIVVVCTASILALAA